jgi:hypothetical protein
MRWLILIICAIEFMFFVINYHDNNVIKYCIDIVFVVMGFGFFIDDTCEKYKK